MAFHFRLEKVLKYRQRLVDQQAQELAKANRLVADITSRITGLSLEINRCETISPGADSLFSASYRTNLSQWILKLRRQRFGLEESRHEAVSSAETQREKMIRAWQELEVLKKLKVRQKELWLEEMQKRENRDLDEVGVQRADRMRREKLATT